MKFISFIYAALTTLLTTPACLYAEVVTELNYNPDSDILSLNIDDVYLDDVLKKLSVEIGFELRLEASGLHRKVSFGSVGKSGQVIEKLVQPNSIVLSYSGGEPNMITRVELLPMGAVDALNIQSEKKSLLLPNTGIPEKDKNHMKRYRQKMKQLEQGYIGERRGSRAQQ